MLNSDIEGPAVADVPSPFGRPDDENQCRNPRLEPPTVSCSGMSNDSNDSGISNDSNDSGMSNDSNDSGMSNDSNDSGISNESGTSGKPERPTLTSPSETTVHDKLITLRGTAEPDRVVRVDIEGGHVLNKKGKKGAQTDGEGRWAKNVELVEGANKIRLTSRYRENPPYVFSDPLDITINCVTSNAT